MAEEMENEMNINFGSADHPITRYEMASRLAYEKELARQRMEISELKSEKISDAKDIELYKQFRSDLKEALEPIKDDVKSLQAHAAAQDVWNAATKGSIIRLHDDVRELMQLTRRRIPNESICPGWGDIP